MNTDGAQQEGAPHERPLRRDDLEFEELDGEAVLYDPRCGAVHRFNAVSLLVWDACDGLHSAADIARAVTATYAVDADEARAQIEELIADFCTRDLLANGCATTANVPAEHEEGSRTRSVVEHTEMAKAVRGPEARSVPMRRNRLPRGLLTRRAMLRGGAAKLAFASPVISTFFARRAYASGVPIHPVLSAFGAGECKNVGYSCIVDPDCCEAGLDKTKCKSNVCCVKSGRSTCYRDEDCCEYPTDTCNAGTCN